tara:strand:+ start:531 stop:932 length:402 start_codon:yes stop_codon:yes gene_type:complete
MADHDLRASGTALYGTAVYGAEQYGGHIQSQSEVTPSATFTQQHILSSVSLEATSEVEVPGTGVKSVLTADDIDIVSEILAVTLKQAHGLISVDVDITTEVTETSTVVEMPPIRQVLRFTSFVAPESTLLLAG